MLRINPTDPHARYNIGNVYLRQQRYAEAAKQYENAFADNPNNPDIANNLGFALMSSGKLEEALPWFEKALALNPKHALARRNMATLQEANNDLKNNPF